MKYFAPWASRGGLGLPKCKNGINIDELVRDRDYFFENDDVYDYLLKHGHKSVAQDQIKPSVDRLSLQNIGGASAAMLTTRRCQPASDVCSSLALEGFVFSSSTSSSAAATEHSDPNSSIYSAYLMRKVRLFQPKGSSSTSSSSPRYTHRDGTCICYKPPTIVPATKRELVDDEDLSSSEPVEDVYTAAKWAVILEDTRTIEKLGVQEIMLAIEDFNCKNTKPRRIFKPAESESKVNNKVKPIKLESANIVVADDGGAKEQLHQRIKELETEIKQHLETLRLKNAEAQTSAIQTQHWVDQHSERKREVHEHSKEIKRLQKSLQSAKADISEKTNAIDRLNSQIVQQQVDFSSKIEAERLKHLHELRSTSEHERKRFLHEQVS